MLAALITIFVVCELYYWFVYFPRAWRDGSNQEINDIKAYVEWVRERGHG